MTFDDVLASRRGTVYADFLLPHLGSETQLLDVGCGEGAISYALAAVAGSVIGIDAEDDFDEARQHALRHGVANVEFRIGDAYALEFPDASFDACFCHSALEAMDRPADALREMHRVLRPGGLVAVASVDYDGILLGGPRQDLLRTFYRVREQLWLLTGSADPYRGKALRGLLAAAGFTDVTGSSTYISYGTQEALAPFAVDRAEECRDEWFAGEALERGLATQAELDEMAQAWQAWGDSPAAYFAFAWCRALGIRP